MHSEDISGLLQRAEPPVRRDERTIAIMKRSSRRQNSSSRKQSEPAVPWLPHVRCGRGLAWWVVQQHDADGRFLNELLNEADRRLQPSRSDRAQALDLASGVLRRRRTIDTLLESQISRPPTYCYVRDGWPSPPLSAATRRTSFREHPAGDGARRPLLLRSPSRPWRRFSSRMIKNGPQSTSR